LGGKAAIPNSVVIERTCGDSARRPHLAEKNLPQSLQRRRHRCHSADLGVIGIARELAGRLQAPLG
jgi:hypothetical protein